jgi:hypothetical protein
MSLLQYIFVPTKTVKWLVCFGKIFSILVEFNCIRITDTTQYRDKPVIRLEKLLRWEDWYYPMKGQWQLKVPLILMIEHSVPLCPHSVLIHLICSTQWTLSKPVKLLTGWAFQWKRTSLFLTSKVQWHCILAIIEKDFSLRMANDFLRSVFASKLQVIRLILRLCLIV